MLSLSKIICFLRGHKIKKLTKFSMLFDIQCQRCNKDLSLDVRISLIPNLIYEDIVDGFSRKSCFLGGRLWEQRAILGKWAPPLPKQKSP